VFRRATTARLWALLLVALAFGCGRTLRDQNERILKGPLTGDLVRQELADDNRVLQGRLERGEIDEAKSRSLMKLEATDLVDKIDFANIPAAKAWEFGEAYRTAEMWPQAAKLYEEAVKVAPDEDRRVNDTLHLAEALAHLGMAKAAIATAKKVMNAAPSASAPILYGVLYQIAPAAKGQGADVELARLLEQAIGKHQATVVDPKTDAGAAFLRAKGTHITRAYLLASELYAQGGDAADAERARESAKGTAPQRETR